MTNMRNANCIKVSEVDTKSEKFKNVISLQFHLVNKFELIFINK